MTEQSKFAHLEITENADGDKVVAEYEGWKTGQIVKVVGMEAEEEGLFDGDEGPLTICVVGSPDYSNEKIAYMIAAEGMDPVETDRSNLEAV